MKRWEPVEEGDVIEVWDEGYATDFESIQATEHGLIMDLYVGDEADTRAAICYLPENLRLCRQVDAEGDAAPLDMPDSESWWAYEDDRDKFVAHLVICRRVNSEIEFKFANSSKDTVSEDTFRAMYPGKWWKLQMPWEKT